MIRVHAPSATRRVRCAAAGVPPASTNRSQSYDWRGNRVAFVTSPATTAPSSSATNPALVLVHGFGSSGAHFRELLKPGAMPAADVYAIDLLGFGESDKPTTVPINMRLYRDQILHFIETHVPPGAPVHLVGNSIGSLAALMVGTVAGDDPEAGSSKVKSVVLLNCAGGLNNKGAAKEWYTKIILPIFFLIDVLLWSPWGRQLFDNVRSTENLKKVLTNLYPSNPGAVDDELVRQFADPAEDPNAFHVFREIYTTSDAGGY